MSLEFAFDVWIAVLMCGIWVTFVSSQYEASHRYTGRLAIFLALWVSPIAVRAWLMVVAA